MSTKIYEAYRIKQSRLENFLRYVYQPTLDKAFEHVQKLLDHVKPEASQEWAKRLFKTDNLAELTPRQLLICKWESLLEIFKKHNNNIYMGNPFDLQSGWNFYPSGRFFYGWPWGSFTLDRDFVLAFPEGGAVDFSYWDNTDRDEEVSSREWRARRQVWSKIGHTPQNTRLVFHIVDFGPMALDSQVYFENKLFQPPYSVASFLQGKKQP